MIRNPLALALFAAFAAIHAFCAPGQEPALPYERQVDLAFIPDASPDVAMDVFVPNGTPVDPVFRPGTGGEGLAIVDVVSGEWRSNRQKLRDHENARVFTSLCARGYTVFAVRPGSRGACDALEMVANIRAAIRFIRKNADRWSIDPQRIGLIGSSAGAHLAALTALEMDEDSPEVPLRAVALFCPPTDFLAWGSVAFEEVARELGDVLFEGGIPGKAPDEIRARAIRLSPARQAKTSSMDGSRLPHFLIFHGQRDPIVPVQQSRSLEAALRTAGYTVKLVVKPGAGHVWLDMPLDVLAAADWFDQTLRD